MVDEAVSNSVISDHQQRFWVGHVMYLSGTRGHALMVEIGAFRHSVESEMLCALTEPTRIPYFNAPIYLENKTQIGKIDEILGPINEVYFTVKMDGGMNASSFKAEDKVYIGGDKLLPIERFLPKPKVPGGVASASLFLLPILGNIC